MRLEMPVSDFYEQDFAMGVTMDRMTMTAIDSENGLTQGMLVRCSPHDAPAPTLTPHRPRHPTACSSTE